MAPSSAEDTCPISGDCCAPAGAERTNTKNAKIRPVTNDRRIERIKASPLGRAALRIAPRISFVVIGTSVYRRARPRQARLLDVFERHAGRGCRAFAHDQQYRLFVFGAVPV